MFVPLQQLADAQLDHILVALKAGDRDFNLRDVLDPWWCYSRGEPFVRKAREGFYRDRWFNAAEAWAFRHALAERSDGCSVGAQAALQSARPVPIILEHSVPLSRICSEIWKSPECWNRGSLRSMLAATMRRVLLTKAEDNKLAHCKLSASMPTGWSIGDDPYARYTLCKIELVRQS